MASPVPTNPFLGAGDGMARPLQMVPRKKNYNFFHKISDEVKFYIKIVENDEI